MKIHKGDKVQVIAGKDKGKIATVLKAMITEGKVVVEGINLVKRHIKPNAVSKEGGIVSIEKPIDVSNVMFYSDKLKRPVRVGFKTIDGKKVRIAKPSGEVLDSGVKASKEDTKATKKSTTKASDDKKSLKKKVEKK